MISRRPLFARDRAGAPLALAGGTDVRQRSPDRIMATRPDPDIEALVERRRITRLLVYWRSLRPIGGVPAFTEFDPRRNPVPWHDCLLLFRSEREGWVFDHFGPRLVRFAGGRPSTVSEVPRGCLVGQLLAGLPALQSDARPWQIEGEAVVAREQLLHRSMILPFRDGGMRIAYVLGALTYFSVGRAIAAPAQTKAPAD
jgi:hypothetical protein